MNERKDEPKFQPFTVSERHIMATADGLFENDKGEIYRVHVVDGRFVRGELLIKRVPVKAEWPE